MGATNPFTIVELHLKLSEQLAPVEWIWLRPNVLPTDQGMLMVGDRPDGFSWAFWPELDDRAILTAEDTAKLIEADGRVRTWIQERVLHLKRAVPS